jgi:hypothetical protein
MLRDTLSERRALLALICRASRQARMQEVLR